MATGFYYYLIYQYGWQRWKLVHLLKGPRVPMAKFYMPFLAIPIALNHPYRPLFRLAGVGVVQAV